MIILLVINVFFIPIKFVFIDGEFIFDNTPANNDDNDKNLFFITEILGFLFF